MPYVSGSGTIADPYIIYTSQDLDDIRLNMVDGTYYKLGANINLTGYSASWIPLGDESAGCYAALDGAGFTVSHMIITSALHNDPFGAAIGLFGLLYAPTITGSYSVKNLTLESCSINLNNYSIGSPAGPGKAELFAGLLAGQWYDFSFPVSKNDWNKIENIKIKSCSINIIKTNITASVTESLSDLHVAGLIGQFNYGLITSCSVNELTLIGKVSSSFDSAIVFVGGLANEGEQATYNVVKNSYIQFEHKTTGSLDNVKSYIAGFGTPDPSVEVHDNYVYNTVVSGNLNISGFSDTIDVDETALGDEDHIFPSGRIWTNATFGNSPAAGVYLFTRRYFEEANSSSLNNYVQTASGYSNDVTPAGMPTINILSVAQMKNSASYSGFDFDGVWNIG